MKHTIVVTDNHELVREAIVALLNNEPDFEVVGHCSNDKQLIDLIKIHQPSVAIIDVAMPKLNGLEITHRIRNSYPSVRIIALSGYLDTAYVRSMIDIGAVGYITKTGAVNTLTEAIRCASHGKVYIDDQILQRMHREFDISKANSSTNKSMLTSREREILQLIAEGFLAKEIALALNIKPTTVKTHRDHIREKLQASTTAELTRQAIRIGLVSVEL
jgi:DNA-binding NarL/FixJ family response regulator